MMTPTLEPSTLGPWAGWRQVGVYGLGLSGRAAAELLRRRGVEVVAFDRRSAQQLDASGEYGELLTDPGVQMFLGREPEHLPPSLDALVVSPGVPTDRPMLQAARSAGLPVLAEVELAFPLLAGPVVAITGSNGKSTTTAMTGELLRAGGLEVEVCGNIGRPLASVVDGPAGRTFVVELSSFQLETVERFRPQAAALLNLSADHLDRHHSLQAYLQAKATIFRRQTETDVAVINADDPALGELELNARCRSFSRRGPVEDGCYLAQDQVLEAVPGETPTALFSRRDLVLPGPHNLENAMAAALLARAMGVGHRDIAAGLARFQGLPHRMQLVLERQGVAWIDDSKGTNPGATQRSLEAFSDRSLHLILGGRNKGADLHHLARLARRKARRIYLIGEAETELAEALSRAADAAGHEPEMVASQTLERAVAQAAQTARHGETVLLSPACASFDQFRDFAHRGRVFQDLVRDLDSGAAKPNQTAATQTAASNGPGGVHGP